MVSCLVILRNRLRANVKIVRFALLVTLWKQITLLWRIVRIIVTRRKIIIMSLRHRFYQFIEQKFLIWMLILLINKKSCFNHITRRKFLCKRSILLWVLLKPEIHARLLWRQEPFLSSILILLFLNWWWLVTTGYQFETIYHLNKIIFNNVVFSIKICISSKIIAFFNQSQSRSSAYNSLLISESEFA